MGKTQWFRLYSEAANDPKLNYLSAEQFRIWFKLLCIASEQEIRGIINEDNFILSLKVSNGNEELLNETIRLLEKLKIISIDEDGQSLIFINFAKRQYDSPSDQPDLIKERVKKCRDKKKNTIQNDVTKCNENETTLKRECNENETERNAYTIIDNNIIDNNIIDNSNSTDEIISEKSTKEEIKEKSAVEEIANYYFTLTGRTANSPDYVAITEVVNSPDTSEPLSSRITMIKSTMSAMAERKARDPATGKINSFKYFKDAILSEFRKKKEGITDGAYGAGTKKPKFTGYECKDLIILPEDEGDEGQRN